MGYGRYQSILLQPLLGKHRCIILQPQHELEELLSWLSETEVESRYRFVKVYQAEESSSYRYSYVDPQHIIRLFRRVRRNSRRKLNPLGTGFLIAVRSGTFFFATAVWSLYLSRR